MRAINVALITLFLSALSPASSGRHIDLTIYFTQNVRGELYPCG